MHSRTLIALLLCSLLTMASPLSARQLDSQAPLDVSEHAGKVVYVDFWASWCVPCRASFPFMTQLHEQFGDDLVIIAINVDEERSEADAFLAHYAPPFRIIYDPKGELATYFDVPGMPSSYIYDRQGQFVERHIGFRPANEDVLRAALQRLVER